MSDPVKLLLTWNIKPGKEEAYSKFITRTFAQVLQDAGLQLIDAWLTKYGDWPEVRVGWLAKDLEFLSEFLQSEVWFETKLELAEYVQDYNQKIIRARKGFQI